MTLCRDWRIFEASQLSPEEILRLWVGNAFISCMVENYQSIECKNESKRHFYQSKNDFVIRLDIIREMPRNRQTMDFLNIIINTSRSKMATIATIREPPRDHQRRAIRRQARLRSSITRLPRGTEIRHLILFPSDSLQFRQRRNKLLR